jgi:hypothetical protein
LHVEKVHTRGSFVVYGHALFLLTHPGSGTIPF